MEYSEILSRIEDIINLSSSSSKTVIICGFNIATNYEEEFTDLIRVENIWYELKNNVAFYVNANIKLKFDLIKIKGDNEEKSKKIDRLCEILSSCSGRSFEDLVLVGNNIILKEDELEYHKLAKSLHVGLYQPAKGENELGKNTKQYERIKNILNIEIQPQINSFIDSKYRDIIYLANNNLIKKEGILKLLATYSDEEYLDLLNELKKYLVISEEEYQKYYHLRNSKSIILDTIEELVLYFSNIDNLSLESLDTFSKYLSPFEYENLLFGLAKKGVISFDDYLAKCYQNKKSEK